jgi:replication factor A1
MSRTFWTRSGRGRRPGGGGSHRERRALEYLAILAVKYGVDPGKFLDCIREAYEKKESEGSKLNVWCRRKTGDSGAFLFTTGSDVVAQFSMSTAIFERGKQLGSLMRTMSARKPSAKGAVSLKIEDLRAGMKNVRLKARVLVIPEPNVVYTRFGTEARVSNVLIADPTGTVRMSLWNKQIDMVSRGDTIEVENGEVGIFEGEPQLRIGRRGSLTVTK